MRKHISLIKCTVICVSIICLYFYSANAFPFYIVLSCIRVNDLVGGFFKSRSIARYCAITAVVLFTGKNKEGDQQREGHFHCAGSVFQVTGFFLDMFYCHLF